MGKLINVGTKERPILVPEKALKPKSPEGREWWGDIAAGSVSLGPEEIVKLEEMVDGQKD